MRVLGRFHRTIPEEEQDSLLITGWIRNSDSHREWLLFFQEQESLYSLQRRHGIGSSGVVLVI